MFVEGASEGGDEESARGGAEGGGPQGGAGAPSRGATQEGGVGAGAGETAPREAKQASRRDRLET